MSGIRIEIDQAECCGSKMCENLAPQAFKLLADGYAAVREGAEDSPLEGLMKAARSCPTQCIILYRDGKEINLF